MAPELGVRLLGTAHGKLVHGRRVDVLAKHLAAMLDPGCKLLDVGCGDGKLADAICQSVPGIEVHGVEIQPRKDCAISCTAFDGNHIPYADKSFDCCMFVDVLHHTTDPLVVLRDACRVSRKFILIKDHIAETRFDHWTLRLMDWVGNRPHGVVLPYAYLSSSDWQALYTNLGLCSVSTERKLPLYPQPFSALFGRKLHFISLLEK
jgi:SAM-dependent methyltransferase